MQLDHIGIAVDQIAEASRFWSDTMGFTTTLEEEVPEMAVRIRKLESHGTTVELLEPTGEEGAIAKFLEKRGPGIHHLSFLVEDIQQSMEEFRARGYQPLYEEPRIGAGGCRVNFFHPRSTHGVLIEIAEAKAKA